MEHMLNRGRTRAIANVLERLFFRSVLPIGGFERIRIAFGFLRVLQPGMKSPRCAPASLPPALSLSLASLVFVSLSNYFFASSVLQALPRSSPFLAFPGYLSFVLVFTHTLYGLARISRARVSILERARAEKFVRRSMPSSKRVSARPRTFLVRSG